MRDGISTIQKVRGAAQTLSGATPNNSAAIDVRGFGKVSIYLETGAITDAGTAAGFTMKLQDSDTLVGASFADVAAAQVLNGPTVTVASDTDDDVTAGVVGYLGSKRYVRAVFTGTTGTNAVVSVDVILGNPHRAPCVPIGATVATT